MIAPDTSRLAVATAALAILMPGIGSAQEITLDIDLDDALGFFVNPDPNYSVVVNLSSPINYIADEELKIWVNFVDLDGSHNAGVGAKQHLAVFDLVDHGNPPPAAANPDQDINVFLNGNIPDLSPDQVQATFDIEFSGVTIGPGASLSGTVFNDIMNVCAVGLFCSTGPQGADLIQGSDDVDRWFYYHDFHIHFSANEDIEFTAFSFGGAADQVEVGIWPVSAPGSMALLGLGLAGLGALGRKKIKSA